MAKKKKLENHLLIKKIWTIFALRKLYNCDNYE